MLLSYSSNRHTTDWDDKLIKYLSFIKRHKRYPLSYQHVSTAIIFSFICANITTFLLHQYHFIDMNEGLSLFYMLGGMLLWFIIFTLVLSLYKRFLAIKTGHSTIANREIILLFLESQDIETFQHPENPDIFRIIGEKGTGRQEVIVFIASVREILIDSYFTFKPSHIVPVLSYKQRMANRLKAWVTMHASDTSFNITP